MDIDAPSPVGGGGEGDRSDFSLVFPLPFRILSLLSLGLLAWATNIHGVTAMGIDAAQVLDVRLDDLDSAGAVAGGAGAGGGAAGTGSLLPRTHPPGERGQGLGGGASVPDGSAPGRKGAGSAFIHPTRLYPPAYQLCLSLAGWTFLGGAVFRYMTQADATLVARWTLFPFLWAALALVALISPWTTTFHRRERVMGLRSLKRIALEGLTAPVPFCDVLMADVMTSFAKVMGDVWVSGCLVVASENGLASQVSDLGCYKEFMVPFMTSLPYIFRLRQCLAEYFGRHTSTPQRSLLNALKYASAFPVIVLSAMQGIYGDPFDPADPARPSTTLQTTLFGLWILAVFVNSLYSFWWDVTNDWGLSLLTPTGWAHSRHRRRRSVGPIRLPSPGPPMNASAMPGGGGGIGAVQPGRNSPPAALEPPHRPSKAAWTPATRQGDTMHRSRSASVQLNTVVTTPDLSAEPDEPNLFPPASSSASATAGRGAGTGSARGHSANRAGHVGFADHGATAGVGRHGHHGHHRPGHAHSRRKSIFNLPFTADPPFLRPTLLLPDPLIYYLAVGIDLLLRFTWSLKLSSHLHEIHEIESGVFLMEGLEVVRRWMWTFLRIEWEAVRMAARPGGGSIIMDDLDGGLGGGVGQPIGSSSDDGQGYAYERSGLGGSSYLSVGGGAHEGLGLGKMGKDSDYETDDSMIMVGERSGGKGDV